jgi:hypothetical protein
LITLAVQRHTLRYDVGSSEVVISHEIAEVTDKVETM